MGVHPRDLRDLNRKKSVRIPDKGLFRSLGSGTYLSGVLVPSLLNLKSESKRVTGNWEGTKFLGVVTRLNYLRRSLYC